MPEQFDVAVIGAGMAGASFAAVLAESGLKIVLLEMEDQPGYHTTGRSAAVFAPSYGPGPIRALTKASEEFFHHPPKGFSQASLLTPRPILMIARADQQDALETLFSEVASPTTEMITSAQAIQYNPLLRPDYVTSGLIDTAGHDIDVAALHQGYLRSFRALGGQIHLRAEVLHLENDGDWLITTRTGVVKTARVVNAAGAWAQKIAKMAGAEEIGLSPKRRTALLVNSPRIISDAPITIDVEEQFYLKPEGAQLLLSPADETPLDACDVQPDELDIAVCIDRITRAFSLKVHRINSRWAGLRSFVADKCPVVGYSQIAPRFFWLAAQGGYGIQSAPAVAQAATAIFREQDLPMRLQALGVTEQELSPARLHGLQSVG